MAGLVVSLVLLGVALADPDACLRSGGDACMAVDHSLVQVISRTGRRPGAAAGKRLPKKEPVALAQVTPVKIDDSRTIANLTAMIENELESFEADLKLLVFGQDKLCSMATHHEARVKVLEKILEVEAGKKTGAHIGSLLQKTAAKDPTMATATAAFGANDYPIESMVSNETLDNLTVDVQQDVHWVEVVLEAISTEKDRIEVVGTDVKTRTEDLVSLLTMEIQQCNAEGFFQPGDSHYLPIMAQTAAAKQGGQQAPMKAQGPPAMMAQALPSIPMYEGPPAMKAQGPPAMMAQGPPAIMAQGPPAMMAQVEAAAHAMMEQAAGPPAMMAQGGGPLALLATRDRTQVASASDFVTFPGWNLTLRNITTSALLELTILEDDIAVLCDMKNKVTVAGDLNSEKLENLDEETNDALKGALEITGPMHAGGPMLLETGMQEPQPIPTMLESPVQAPLQYKFPSPKTGPIENLTLANATNGIDQQIFNLEQDMNTISKEKRMVCLAQAKYLERVQTIVQVINTLEC